MTMNLSGYDCMLREIGSNSEYPLAIEEANLKAVGDCLDPLLSIFTNSSERSDVWRKFVADYRAVHNPTQQKLVAELTVLLHGVRVNESNASKFLGLIDAIIRKHFAALYDLDKKFKGIKEEWDAHVLWGQGKYNAAKALLPNIDQKYAQSREGKAGSQVYIQAREKYKSELKNLFQKLATAFGTFFAVIQYGFIPRCGKYSVALMAFDNKNKAEFISFFKRLANILKVVGADKKKIGRTFGLFLRLFNREARLIDESDTGKKSKEMKTFLQSVAALFV